MNPSYFEKPGKYFNGRDTLNSRANSRDKTTTKLQPKDAISAIYVIFPSC